MQANDLLVAAAQTGKKEILKGQFLSADILRYAVEKIKSSGNNNVWITERGSMFGYQDIVVDFRGIPAMKKIAPTILDITHSIQKTKSKNGITGGNPELIETIAKAGIAVGVDGIFIETHPNPKNAKSDGANMLPLDKLEDLLRKLTSIRETITKF